MADMKVLQAERKESKAESDSAIERLRVGNETAIERLRTSHETAIGQLRVSIAEQSKELTKFTATMAVGIVVVLGGFMAVLHFLE